MAIQWAGKRKRANRNLFVFVVVVVVMVLFCFFACIFFAGNVQEKKEKRSYHANSTKKNTLNEKKLLHSMQVVK